MNYLKRYSKYIILCSNPMLDISKADKITSSRTIEEFRNRKISTETGWDRVKKIFESDEYGTISSELNSIHQAGFLGLLIGALYGGILSSRGSYVNFMENNEATTFKSHLDAKKKLQNEFTVNFAKGSLRWGWRVGLFTTSYVTIITLISVYREKSSIFEYLIAGLTTGAVYKINLGLRGMIAGGVLGGALGGVAGTLSLLLMKASGTTMEEVRYWQYKWKLERDNSVNEAIKSKEPEDELVKNHDDNIINKIGIQNIE